MSKARLLLRDNSSKSLKAIVEASQKHQSTHQEYQLEINNNQFILTPVKQQTLQNLTKQLSLTDEGFESDIDSISLISTEESFTPPNKNQETDSANGSACSDSDETDSSSPQNAQTTTHARLTNQESFNLVNCVCYTDIKFPDVLVFVILSDTLVFKFDNINDLQKFYANFSTVKAVTNQRAYGINKAGNFNLLQRTDSNGITHIEISRQGGYIHPVEDYEPSSIISINTPEIYKPVLKKALSTENILDEPLALRKIWNSAENLLEAPKKPERRKKLKAPAPPPPTLKNDIYKGQFVRVNVNKSDQVVNVKSPTITNQDSRFLFVKNKPGNTANFQQFRFSDPKRLSEAPTPSPLKIQSWTGSIPRLLKKTRSEGRLFAPMAYRYIDTTLTYQPPSYVPRYKPNPNKNTQTFSNRLFGMSSKLKEFSSVQSSCNLNSKYEKKDPRYGSLGNLTFSDGNLKSVIKKDDVKKKNDKKVTFSAYNTVQVV